MLPQAQKEPGEHDRNTARHDLKDAGHLTPFKTSTVNHLCRCADVEDCTYFFPRLSVLSSEGETGLHCQHAELSRVPC